MRPVEEDNRTKPDKTRPSIIRADTNSKLPPKLPQQPLDLRDISSTSAETLSFVAPTCATSNLRHLAIVLSLRDNRSLAP